MSVLGYSQLLKGGSTGSSLTRIAFTSKQETTTNFPTTLTTDAINTTGSNMVVVVVCDYNSGSGSMSDNKGNTFTLAQSRQTTTNSRISVYYLTSSAIYGSSHTFTYTSTLWCIPNIYVYAYSGASTSPYLTWNSTTTSGAPVSSLTTGSITPAVNGALLITAFATIPSSGTGNTPTISGGGFTNSNRDAWYPLISAKSLYSGCYSLVQTVAGASNPTHTFNGASEGAVVLIIAFK